MAYAGTAIVDFLGKDRAAIVELSPEDESIYLRFPTDVGSDFGGLGNKGVFEKPYRLTNLSLDLPLGSVRNAELKGLLLTNVSPGTMSIYDSRLIRALRLYPKDIGLTELKFTPSHSLVRLPVSALSKKGYSELVFFDNRISTRRHISTKIGQQYVTLTGDRNLLIVRSKRNLLNELSGLQRALSLLQGGRILYRAGIYGQTLELNFVQRGLLRPLGTIFDESGDVGEFLTRFISYERSLSGTEKNRHDLAIEYIIDGCAGSAPLENKVISFFTALEIMDGSRTLNKTTIHNLLGIAVADAELVVKVRNKLIHEGKGLAFAIQQSYAELKRRGRMNSLPFKGQKVSKNRLASNFRFYLLELLISTVMEQMGMPRRRLNYSQYYT